LLFHEQPPQVGCGITQDFLLKFALFQHAMEGAKFYRKKAGIAGNAVRIGIASTFDPAIGKIGLTNQRPTHGQEIDFSPTLDFF